MTSLHDCDGWLVVMMSDRLPWRVVESPDKQGWGIVDISELHLAMIVAFDWTWLQAAV